MSGEDETHRIDDPHHAVLNAGVDRRAVKESRLGIVHDEIPAGRLFRISSTSSTSGAYAAHSPARRAAHCTR